MTIQQREHAADPADVERLGTAFNRCFETLDAPDGVFAPDVFCDLLPPFWRFQLQGPDALIAQLRANSRGPATARILRLVPTATGFVVEHEETGEVGGGRVEVSRRMHLCEVRGGLITEVLTYCNGGWDEELRARQAAEAPLLDRNGKEGA